MSFLRVSDGTFEEDIKPFVSDALEILPCEEVPGVSQYVEVSSVQPVRYAVTRKRTSSSPLRLFHSNDSLPYSDYESGMRDVTPYGQEGEEGEYIHGVDESEGYCQDVDLVSKRVDANVTFEDDAGGSVEEMYRILEKRADSLDEHYAEACKVIQSVEQPFYLDNRRYRAQKAADRSVRGCVSVSCSSCRLKFFWPPDTLRMHITWLHLPGCGLEPHLTCPICGCYTPTELS